MSTPGITRITDKNKPNHACGMTKYMQKEGVGDTWIQLEGFTKG